MANCKVKSYKAEGGWVAWLIRFRSDPHWHTEFQFSERYDNISSSSTRQDGENGVRNKQIAYSHPERWTTHIITLTDSQEDMIYNLSIEMDDKKYDLWGLLSFGTRWRIIKPSIDKLWCSEYVAFLLMYCKKYPDLIPDQMHPQGLVEYLDERT